MKRNGPSFALLSLAVVIPLMVLATVAWIGNRAQTRSAWDAARDEAGRFAHETAGNFAKALEDAAATAPLIANPPVAGSGRAFPATDDTDELRQLRDDPSQSLTDSGLPMRVIAAMRLADQTKTVEDARLAATMALAEPSIITSRVLSEIGRLHPAAVASTATERWNRDEDARKAAGIYPEADTAEHFDFGDANPVIWFRRTDQGIRYVHRVAFEASARKHSGKPWDKYGLWMGVRIFAGDHILLDFVGPGTVLETSRREVMAERPIPFGDQLRIRITAAKPEMILSSARNQANWTSALLLCAVGVSAGGLWMMHRVVARERKLNAMKSDFVAGVSHELRAPIASIRLMADALDSGKIGAETAGEFHRLISREGARLSTLIENVLDFARIEQDRKQWRFEETDLATLLRETASVMMPLAEEKKIRLQTADVPETVSARIDAGAVQQALMNLIDNAIKFSPPGTRVLLRFRDDGPHLRISIADEGSGIPKGEHQRIFEKFHRLGGELRRETQGTGIGLSLVKAIAEAHGGRVELESSPGNGSIFTLVLPKGGSLEHSGDPP